MPWNCKRVWKQTNTVITAIFCDGVYACLKPDTNFNKKTIDKTNNWHLQVHQSGGFYWRPKDLFYCFSCIIFQTIRHRSPETAKSIVDSYNASFCVFFFPPADIKGVRSSLIQGASGTKSKNSGGLCYPNGAEATRGQYKPYIMCHLINRSCRCAIISNYRFTSDMTLHHGSYITYLRVGGDALKNLFFALLQL